MIVTNPESGTNVEEIADDIYRINTPMALPNGSGFSFNQYVILDEAPLLFHTGLRQLFPLVREAVASLLPIERLRYIGFSHVEADECGSLNDWLAAAPQAVPLCGAVAAMVSINDLADRKPIGLADGALLPLGRHSVRWLDAPHLPHAWARVDWPVALPSRKWLHCSAVLPLTEPRWKRLVESQPIVSVIRVHNRKPRPPIGSGGWRGFVPCSEGVRESPTGVGNLRGVHAREPAIFLPLFGVRRQSSLRPA